MRRFVALLLVVTTLSVTATCSSDGDSEDTSAGGGGGTGGASAELREFAERANLACYDARRQSINRPVNLQEYADLIVDRAESGRAQVSQLELPEEHAEELREHLVEPYLQAADAAISRGDALRQAAAQSQEAFNDVLGEIVVGSILAWTLEDMVWLEQNGMRDCAPDLRSFVRQS